MTRSTRKSLASSAAAMAKKVIGRGSSAAESATASPSVKTAVPAKKAAAAGKKAAPAKKTAPAGAAKKAAPAKSAAAKATPAKKAAPAKKTTAGAAKRAAAAAPAKKTTPAKKTPTTRSATAAKTAVKATPTRKVASRTPAAAPRPRKLGARAVALAVKPGEANWTKAELNEVVADLTEHRQRLANLLQDQEAELAGLMRDAGDGAGHDQADMGATSFERDQELTVVNNERDMLAQIDRALARIEDGSYGICESCGEPIGKLRVMAFPRATLCMSCKQREERR